MPNEHQSVMRAALVMIGEMKLLQLGMFVMVRSQDLPGLLTPWCDEFAKPIAP